jgi:hypothetical protein
MVSDLVEDLGPMALVGLTGVGFSGGGGVGHRPTR